MLLLQSCEKCLMNPISAKVKVNYNKDFSYVQLFTSLEKRCAFHI